jgi:hypothetical protein
MENAVSAKVGELRMTQEHVNPLTPELNPSAQRCLARFLIEDLAS